MNDRERLEYAAKAAGIEIGWIDPVWNNPDAVPYIHLLGGKLWNPITDDGDALRLAVKLKLSIDIDEKTSDAFPRGSGHAIHSCGDSYAATRRAIVRAAAEIGKAMK